MECEGNLESFEMCVDNAEIQEVGKRLMRTYVLESKGDLRISLKGEEAKKVYEFLFKKKGQEIKIKLVIE